jgi:hypothetical protein
MIINLKDPGTVYIDWQVLPTHREFFFLRRCHLYRLVRRSVCDWSVGSVVWDMPRNFPILKAICWVIIDLHLKTIIISRTWRAVFWQRCDCWSLKDGEMFYVYFEGFSFMCPETTLIQTSWDALHLCSPCRLRFLSYGLVKCVNWK